MAEIIFSQRLYSDLKERRLYASLQEAFTADLKNRNRRFVCRRTPLFQRRKQGYAGICRPAKNIGFDG